MHMFGTIGLVGLGIFVMFAVAVFFSKEFIGGMFGIWRIVPVNEAHIRIFGHTKEVFSSRTQKSAYWYIPFMTKLHKLPLINLAIPVNDIKLNDKDMAKFICDIMCFVNISNIELAAERLELTDTDKDLGFDFVKLSTELKAIMESIGRTVATKQTILEIYRDRASLDSVITREVEAVFPKWGISLVDLELTDIKDAAGSTVIQDIERVRAAEVRKEADVKSAEATQAAEIAKAKSEEAYRRQQVEKDRQIALAQAKMQEDVSVANALANKKAIEATRELEYGRAEIARQVTERNAEAQKQRLTLEAEGESQKIMSIGEAQADVIRKTKFAEAEGTEKLALAMQNFNDAAMGVKMLDVQKEILIAKFQAFATSLSRADIKWIMSGSSANKLFGINLDAEGGAQMQQFMEESGISMEAIKKLIEAKQDN